MSRRPALSKQVIPADQTYVGRRRLSTSAPVLGSTPRNGQRLLELAQMFPPSRGGYRGVTQEELEMALDAKNGG